MAVSTGSIISLSGTVGEVVKNEAVGSRYRIFVKTQGKLTSLYMEEDEFSGSQDINGAVTVPARVESVTDDEVSGVTVKVRVKAADKLVHLTVSENDISGSGSGSNSGSGDSGSGDSGSGSGDSGNSGSGSGTGDSGNDSGNSGSSDSGNGGNDSGSGSSGNTTTDITVTVTPVDPDLTLFGTPVSDMQENVRVNDDNIAAVLKPLTSGALVDTWGEGHFIALQFDSENWDDAETIRVGLDPSEGSGLVDIKDDPDKNGVFKITNPISQVFVVEVNGVAKLYDLSEVVFE